MSKNEGKPTQNGPDKKAPGQNTPDQKTPEMKNPEFKTLRFLPPHLLLICALWQTGLGYLETGVLALHTGGMVMLVLAVAVILWCAVIFRRQQTTILPGDKPSSLITAGPFRYSRNPIYVAMVMVLLGLWAMTGGFSPFMVIVLFILIMQHRYIEMEEEHMLRIFGAEYIDYCQQVRRWV